MMSDNDNPFGGMGGQYAPERQLWRRRSRRPTDGAAERTASSRT